MAAKQPSYLQRILTQHDALQHSEMNVVEPALLVYVGAESRKIINFLEQYYIPYAVAEHKDGRVAPSHEKYRWLANEESKTLMIEIKISLHKYIYKSEHCSYNVTSSVCNGVKKYFAAISDVKINIEYTNSMVEQYWIILCMPMLGCNMV